MVGDKSWYVLAVLVVAAAAQDPFTLEEFVRGNFAQTGFTGTWISDTEFTYTIPNESGIYMFNVENLNSTVLVAPELLELLNTTRPILSADREFILAPREVESVYRYSTTARFSLYEISTQNVVHIANNERLQLCIFGSGHSLAYVLNNNLYYLPENSIAPYPLTTDGIEGIIYNGHTDWVYEEDVMYTGQATWFSKDGSYLAFATFNDTEVESYSYYYYADKSDPDDVYPELVDLKYPKVGRTNPSARLRVVNLRTLVENNDFNFIDLEAPEEVTDDHILGGVIWPTDTEIAVHWLNRRQNYTILRICNIVTNVCVDERREQPNGWVPSALPRFSSDGSYYVSTRWSLPQVDERIWQHLYLSLRIGNETESSSITPGLATVNSFVGMNEAGPYFYYTRTVPGSQWQSEVRRGGAMDGCISCNIVLPEGGPCTWAAATASLGGRYLTVTCSSPNEPSATYIVDPLQTNVQNSILYVWENNTVVRDRLVGKTRPQSVIFTVPLENGIEAPVRLHIPPGVDLTDNSTTYPMIYYVYSGPNTNTVFNSFTVGYHSYIATSRNTIYMLADGRGAGLNGQDILYALNNKLGTVEVEDHLVILRQVLNRYPAIDPKRVGIWGHSYGGYATLLTLIKDDEHMFRCGVASALVTSWLYYNTMYTERYMGLPTLEDNLRGYEEGDITLLAEKLRGHDFFIMHGNADDNVHYQNAAKLLRALQELDIPFRQMSYPDEAHSLAGVNLHRYDVMNRYWEKCLNMP
ncbi:apoptotic chromatin condensation inducer-like protein [Aphomia sociella]